MKLYISSINEIINKERAQSILKDVGITKEIDDFSDCKNNCHCNEFREGLEIRFDSFRRIDTLSSKLKRIFLNPFINLFIKNKDKRFIGGFCEVGGYFTQESKDKNSISLFLDKIIKFNAEIDNLLSHEIMHIKKPIGHCDKPFCIFYNKGMQDRINQISLCEDCKKIYAEILREINSKLPPNKYHRNYVKRIKGGIIKNANKRKDNSSEQP